MVIYKAREYYNKLPELIRNKVEEKINEPMSIEMKTAYIELINNLGINKNGSSELNNDDWILLNKIMTAINLKDEIAEYLDSGDCESEVLEIVEKLKLYIDYHPDNMANII